MEKDKSRGIKHIKDKRKYKGNTTKNPKYVPRPTAKPNLGSNWDRYEIPQDEDLNRQLLSPSTDFEVLSNLPVSLGSHFQFKNDKIGNDVNANEGFCLNLDLLDRSLLTIAFYERMGIEKKWFEESELAEMDQDAVKNLNDFNALVANTTNFESIIPENSLCPTSAEKSDNPDEGDEILELIDSCSLEETHNVSDQVHFNKTEDKLEQWLEDLLDD